MDARRARAFVQTRGDAIERARLNAILWGMPPFVAALRGLSALQKADGGFAQYIREVSTVCATLTVLEWCDDLGLRRGPLVEAACLFLLERQQTDGGWDEVEAVRAFYPPAWMTPGRIETRVWLTAGCAHALLRMGCLERAQAGVRPAEFLLTHMDASGKLAGYQRSTWIALPVLTHQLGRESEPWHRALAFVEASYSPDWEGSLAAWMLRCLQDAGLPRAQPLVARALADLQRKQRSNGSWESEDGEAFAVSATLEALRVLKGYGEV